MPDSFDKHRFMDLGGEEDNGSVVFSFLVEDKVVAIHHFHILIFIIE